MSEFNAFKRLEHEWMSQLPPELEFQVSSQVRSAAAAGRVADIFLPCALRTAAHLVGGGAPGKYSCLPPGRGIMGDALPDWRRPPGRF
ncbi:MAG: hypothetical protein RMJ33_01540 [Saprospiraceae bacterium]|nr:hypothetical protein [Saprospiraceae bacterium]MDW8228494.1 hypothetical protein [Saprospiraceae bacterium]